MEEEELPYDEDFKVVRCFGCDSWVRQMVTKLVPTGPRADLEIWCMGCITAVDETTSNLMLDEE